MHGISFATLIHRYFEEETKNALLELKEAQEAGTFDPDNDPHLLHQLLSDSTMSVEDIVFRSIFGLFIAGGETVRILKINT